MDVGFQHLDINLQSWKFQFGSLVILSYQLLEIKERLYQDD